MRKYLQRNVVFQPCLCGYLIVVKMWLSGSQEVAKKPYFHFVPNVVEMWFCLASDKSLNHINMADAP